MYRNIGLIVCICILLPVAIQSNIDKPIVIAHRGASGYLPEHTLESKVAALTMGSDYIEQDVVLTKDYIPICLHDIFLDEVTDVARKFPSNFRIHDGSKRYFAADFTLEEIKKLQVSERFHHGDMNNSFFENRFPVWQSSFHLHTLEEEIQMIQGFEKSYNQIHNINEGDKFENKTFGIYVEIKRPDFHSKNFSRIVLDVVEKYYINSRDSKVIIQCFDPTELQRIRTDLKSEYTLIQLLELDSIKNGINYTYWNSLPGLEKIATYAEGVGPNIKGFIDLTNNKPEPSEFHQNVKSLNLLTHPWTFRVDQVPSYFSTYNEMLEFSLKVLKVDGLFTDFPDITLKFVNDYLGNSAKRLNLNISFILISLFYSIVINY